MAGRGPFAFDDDRLVKNIAQPEHGLRSSTHADRRQRGLEFAERAERNVVDDEHVGIEPFEGGADRLRPKPDDVIERARQVPGAVGARRRMLAKRRQRDAIDTRRHAERAAKMGPGDEQHRRAGVSLDDTLGERQVAADVPQPHGVVRVKCDSWHIRP